MITRYDEKMTGNDYAKALIIDKFDELLDCYWLEDNFDIFNFDGSRKMTEREEYEIKMMLVKTIKGLSKYLGWTSPRADNLLNHLLSKPTDDDL